MPMTSFDVDDILQEYVKWRKHKHAGIMTYRNNYCCESMMTGTMAPLHHTPWEDEFDDSIENYLRN